MKWFVLVAVVNVIAAVLYYFRIRQNRHNNLEATSDAPASAGFYPEIEKCHEINSRSITCSCPDFRKVREQFRHDDPRRLCKHLAKSFIDAGSLPEDLALFEDGIRLSAEGHSGFPSDRRRFDRLFSGKRISLMVPKEITEEDPWIDVYYETRRYSYFPKHDKWANEMSPPQEGEVIGFLYEKLGDPVPGLILSRLKNSSLVQTPGKEDPQRAAVCGFGGFQDVEARLKTILPPETELSLKETKSYIAVTINGTRKWICRLYLASVRTRYIGFPDGRKYEISCSEDIMKYRAQLLTVYREKAAGKVKADTLFPMSEHNASPLGAASAKGRDNVQFFSQN